MKPRLLVMLLLCALLLTACYRQTEEPFQQVDSAEVIVVATPTSIEAVVEDGTVSAEEGEALAETGPVYVTPEVVPGQVEQPTVELPTAAVIGLTSPADALTPFVRATATAEIVEELDPNHECVYTVLAGDNLFRLSLAWGTTVDEIMTTSGIESDALSIGQLLLRPGCEYSVPTARPEESPAPVLIATEAPAETAETDSEIAVETEVGSETEVEGETEVEVEAEVEVEVETEAEAATETPAGPRVHVVSAGETIESISLRYRVDVNQLIALNNLTNPNRLLVGQELLLPD